MRYRIHIRRSMQRQLETLPGNIRQRIRRFVNTLPDNPHPDGASHLREHPHIWRYRIERWRVVWRIYEEERLIVVVKIGQKHGPEFYADVIDGMNN